MSSAQSALDTLAGSLQIAPVSAPTELGQPVVLKLTPPAENLSVIDSLSGTLSITWLAKNVNLLDSKLLISPLSTSIPADLLNGAAPATGIIGQIEGTLSIPTQLPVTVNVSWTAFDAQNNPLKPNIDYVAQGASSPQVSFLFGLVSDQPFVNIRIHAEVTLTIADPSVTPFSASLDLPLLIRAVTTIPTIVALFQRPNFNVEGNNRYVLVVVPLAFPAVTVNEIVAVLQTLRSVVSTLSSIQRFLQLLTGIDLLTKALTDSRQKIAIRRADGIPKFYSIVFKRKYPWKTIVDTAQDLMSSVVFMGPPWRGAELFNSPEYAIGEGQLNVGKTLALFVLINDLSNFTFSGFAGTYPATVPPDGAVIVHRTQYLGTGFDNKLSSLRFS